MIARVLAAVALICSVAGIVPAFAANDPDFFWLPPTVAAPPAFTGPFDATVLNSLIVEVCKLDQANQCVAPPMERFTSTTLPQPNRIKLNSAGEYYTVDWLTGRSHVSRDEFYRVTVFKGATPLGSIDVDVVQNKKELDSVDFSRHIAVVHGHTLTLQFRVQHPTARTRVRVNEVESNGGVPGDWIEFFNTAIVPVSLGGYVVKDNDDTHAYTLPSDAVIAALGYYVVEEAALGFGLGGADAARLFTPNGAVLVDAYNWAAHAPTTYGRCPNGTGVFQTNNTTTKGSANDCTIIIRINEVESDAGVPGDWVELFNPGPAPANLEGFTFRDNDGHSYGIPSVIVAAGAYIVLDEAQFGFGLDAADAARVFRADGTLADSHGWTAHAATTYGRCPNGSGFFITTLGSTKGATNNCFVPVTTLHINEVESNGGVPGDWIELFNGGAATLDLSGWVVRDNDDTHTHALPAGSTIAGGGYLLVEEAALGFGLGAADSVRIYDPTGSLYETFSWTAHATTTYGRCPNGTGAFRTTTSVTKGAANDCSSPVRINEIESSDGIPDDWIELFNPTASAVDVGGFVLRDNDDTHTFTLPAGTAIPASGYLAVDVAAAFGLGSADSARLFDAAGLLVDTYSWTSHAATTYGRCPNGTGVFTTTASATKGGANDCTVATATVHINEVESNGGSPGDWVELHNHGTSPVDLSGWRILDNDDTHTASVLPSGSVIAPNGYLIVEESALGFGLGAADSVRLFDPGATLIETFSWTAHAATTYGRCPNGTGAFATTTSVTKGAANDCGVAVKINEIESNGGLPDDWVELFNPGTSTADLSGFVLRDNDDTHTMTIPSGTTIAAGGYAVFDVAPFFGLGSADSVRLFDAAGLLLDSHSWTAHAATTYGRCPNGTGPFTTTTNPTRGALNECPGQVNPLAWPGDPNVQTIDGTNVFGGNMSGLVYEGAGAGPGTLWAVRNGPGTLFRLIWDGTIWTPDPASNWSAGKLLRYPGDVGSPDSEGATFTTDSFAGMYVATERDNNVSGTSRNSILRFDPSAPGTTLVATREWNLTADLPAVGANLGIEAITWIPDSFLVSAGFFDETKGHVYNPGEYADHGGGLFFVGVEADGMIYAYALNHATGTFARVATIASSLAGVMDLYFDRETLDLWAICDDTCQGRSVILRINAATGKFGVVRLFDRPSGMPNLNNEGFAVAPTAECVNNLRPAYWADDSETGGHAIRRGAVACTAP
jgi:hypothetical protein